MECDTECGEAHVDLAEGIKELVTQRLPEAHLAYIELMKRDGRDVEEETALIAWVRHQVDRQDDEVTIAQN
ncbi:hypothetical protein WMF27_30195 [Sorangium sp. So ce281]|uniref:hypothetical protein n=1 Tax=unclassified Sorangium TaxID=2621164 RepID=UPI003F6085EE